MKNIVFFLFLTILLSCGTKKADTHDTSANKDSVAGNDAVGNADLPSSICIVLKDEHSITKNPGKEVASYTIPDIDSFVVDITGYHFVLPDPAFTDIRDNFNYTELLGAGGSFAYIDILYGDSGQISPRNPIWCPGAHLRVIEKDKKFSLSRIKKMCNGKVPTEFILAFRAYIDSPGGGQQEIDRFKVKVQ